MAPLARVAVHFLPPAPHWTSFHSPTHACWHADCATRSLMTLGSKRHVHTLVHYRSHEPKVLIQSGSERFVGSSLRCTRVSTAQTLRNPCELDSHSHNPSIGPTGTPTAASSHAYCETGICVYIHTRVHCPLADVRVSTPPLAECH